MRAPLSEPNSAVRLPPSANGGTLEKAQQMAAHASTRTTQLYDRRSDEISLDEVERIVI